MSTTTLRRRLDALKKREQETRPTVPPFVVAVEDPLADGGARAVTVFTVRYGVSRCFEGEQAEAVWDKYKQAERQKASTKPRNL
jgi:hypothetical protein